MCVRNIEKVEKGQMPKKLYKLVQRYHVEDENKIWSLMGYQSFEIGKWNKAKPLKKIRTFDPIYSGKIQVLTNLRVLKNKDNRWMFTEIWECKAKVYEDKVIKGTQDITSEKKVDSYLVDEIKPVKMVK